MALISLEEAKSYLRVDTEDEDAMIDILLRSAERLCVDVARLTDEQWNDINSRADYLAKIIYIDILRLNGDE